MDNPSFNAAEQNSSDDGRHAKRAKGMPKAASSVDDLVLPTELLPGEYMFIDREFFSASIVGNTGRMQELDAAPRATDEAETKFFCIPLVNIQARFEQIAINPSDASLPDVSLPVTEITATGHSIMIPSISHHVGKVFVEDIHLRTQLGSRGFITLVDEFDNPRITFGPPKTGMLSLLADPSFSMVASPFKTAVKENTFSISFQAQITLNGKTAARELNNTLSYHISPQAYRVLFGKPDKWDPKFQVEHFLEKIIPDPSETDVSFTLPDLLCELYPFQARSVRWMLKREGKHYGSRIEEIDPRWLRESGGPVKAPSCPYYSCFRMEDPPYLDQEIYSGGILSEEMGLGKTVEVIALLLLNRMPVPNSSSQATSPNHRLMSKATLIITPLPILNQWIVEFAKKAPSLSVIRYEGGSHVSVEALINCDVIIADYKSVAQEIHYARPDNGRPRREERKYERRSSPLVDIDFWRLCIDEAQMIGSSSTVAEIASLITRHHTWAITGTPLSGRNNEGDLRDLASLVGIGDLFKACAVSSSIMEQLFRIFLRRNTKKSISTQIDVPPQRENLVMIEFTPVERHYYDSHRMKMLEQFNESVINVSSNDVDQVQMNSWLLRLRQTCSHPQIGAYNQNLLGAKARSLPEILQKMIKESRKTVGRHFRAFLSGHISRGILHEVLKRWQSAITIYEETYEEANKFIESSEFTTEKDADEDDGKDDSEDTSAFTFDLLLHRVVFCLASVYLHIEEKQKSDRLFEEAERIRKSLMKSREDEVMKVLNSTKASMKAFEKKLDDASNIPELDGLGIAVAFVLEEANELIDFLNKQSEQVKLYREKIKEIAFSDLHNEYSEDAERQLYGGTCLNHYMMSCYTRKRHVTALNTSSIPPPNLGVDYRNRPKAVSDTEFAMDGTKVPPEPLTLEDEPGTVSPVGLSSRKRKPKTYTEKSDDESDEEFAQPETLTRSLETLILRMSAKVEDIDTTYKERACIEEFLEKLQEIRKKQVEILVLMDQDISRFSRLWNKRIEFYKALQRLSDDVAIPDVQNAEKALEENEQELLQTKKLLDKERGHYRYLLNLQDAQKGDGYAEKTCLICYEKFANQTALGMTPCGHIYCLACLRRWMSGSSKCPTCNLHIVRADIRKVVLGNSQLSLNAITTKGADTQAEKFGKYPFPPITDLPELSSSYGSKIDTIVRYIKYLISKDRVDFKCLLFSQWAEVLSVFALALEQERISFLSYGVFANNRAKMAKIPEQFQVDPSVKVLLMNTKSQSSGLTLTKATHVFLVEPTLNPVLEWQAKGRVHRLGQTQETWVHRFVVKDSVEQEIFALRNKRETTDMHFDPLKQKDIKDDEVGREDVIYLLNKEFDSITLARNDQLEPDKYF